MQERKKKFFFGIKKLMPNQLLPVPSWPSFFFFHLDICVSMLCRFMFMRWSSTHFFPHLPLAVCVRARVSCSPVWKLRQRKKKHNNNNIHNRHTPPLFALTDIPRVKAKDYVPSRSHHRQAALSFISDDDDDDETLRCCCCCLAITLESIQSNPRALVQNLLKLGSPRLMRRSPRTHATSYTEREWLGIDDNDESLERCAQQPWGCVLFSASSHPSTSLRVLRYPKWLSVASSTGHASLNR